LHAYMCRPEGEATRLVGWLTLPHVRVHVVMRTCHGYCGPAFSHTPHTPLYPLPHRLGQHSSRPDLPFEDSVFLNFSAADWNDTLPFVGNLRLNHRGKEILYYQGMRVTLGTAGLAHVRRFLKKHPSSTPQVIRPMASCQRSGRSAGSCDQTTRNLLKTVSLVMSSCRRLSLPCRQPQSYLTARWC
jgi:hypothetical protein